MGVVVDDQGPPLRAGRDGGPVKLEGAGRGEKRDGEDKRLSKVTPEARNT